MGCFHRGQLRLEPPHLKLALRPPPFLTFSFPLGKPFQLEHPGPQETRQQDFLHRFCSHLQLNEPKLLGASGHTFSLD